MKVDAMICLLFTSLVFAQNSCGVGQGNACPTSQWIYYSFFVAPGSSGLGGDRLHLDIYSAGNNASRAAFRYFLGFNCLPDANFYTQIPLTDIDYSTKTCAKLTPLDTVYIAYRNGSNATYIHTPGEVEQRFSLHHDAADQANGLSVSTHAITPAYATSM
jgi:hypothetical protein